MDKTLLTSIPHDKTQRWYEELVCHGKILRQPIPSKRRKRAEADDMEVGLESESCKDEPSCEQEKRRTSAQHGGATKKYFKENAEEAFARFMDEMDLDGAGQDKEEDEDEDDDGDDSIDNDVTSVFEFAASPHKGGDKGESAGDALQLQAQGSAAAPLNSEGERYDLVTDPAPQRPMHAKAAMHTLRAFKIGGFRFTPKHNAGQYGGYECSCPHHRRSKVSGCKKFSALSGPLESHRKQALLRLHIWALCFGEHSRQRFHVGTALVGDPLQVMPLSIIRFKLHAMSQPAELAKTDIELDELDGLQVAPQMRARAPKAKVQPKPGPKGPKAKAKARNRMKLEQPAAQAAEAGLAQQERGSSSSSSSGSSSSSSTSSSSSASSSS